MTSSQSAPGLTMCSTLAQQGASRSASLVVSAVSAPHRAEALAVCKEAVNTLKQTVALWRKELHEGGEEWIGSGS